MQNSPSIFISAIGIIGNALLILAYLPQFIKIIKTKKAEDISILMWAMYGVGDIFLLIYSLSIGDKITSALFIGFSLANLLLIILSIKYGKVTIKS